MADISQWEILIVEDEPNSMEMMKELLTHYRIRSYAAYSAEAALELMRTIHPTLVIVDLALPKMDGWELLQALRSNPATAGIPAVAVTGYDSESVAQQTLRAGFEAYFPKPVNASLFMKELVRLLSSR